MGETPQRLAKEASHFRRCGLSLRPPSAASLHGVRTDTRKGGQLRGGIRHQPIQLLIEFGDFFAELLVAPCHRAQRELLRGRLRVIRSSSGAQKGTGVDQTLGRELAQREGGVGPPVR
jgi:hypothetical protein